MVLHRGKCRGCGVGSGGSKMVALPIVRHRQGWLGLLHRSMRWFVRFCWLRLVALRQFTKGASCGRFYGFWGTRKEPLCCRMPCKGHYGGDWGLPYEKEMGAHLPYLTVSAWWTRCAPVFLQRCEKATCYCSR
ncbi:hypothetical protein [Prevotella intermedia]|uniref:hypothetical protein n=1 Tax=Prevotella intermedia TaxID=28131 RepID=UPI0012FE636B|nr:hypothetical protein [Prevotella intermedia]